MENEVQKKENDSGCITSPSFKDSIKSYIKNINALMEISPLIMNLVIGKITQESKQLNSFLENISLDELKIVEEEPIQEAQIVEENDSSKSQKELTTNEESDDNSKNIFIPFDSFPRFIELSNKIEASTLAYKYLPISIIISLVSQYDAYLNNLIKTIFHIKPEILNSSERNIQYTDLISFNNIGEAKDYVIEKEIESVLRENHLSQLKWLEKKLSIKLRDGIPNLVSFIELTERRNLFVHCNGVVSRQYLDICKENKVPNIDKLKPGDKLDVKPIYLTKSFYTLFEIGVKLGHVLWRKLQPESLKEADEYLNDICYDLISIGRYNLAQNLLIFATETLKKHSNQEILCILKINKALSIYLKGDKTKAQELLKKQDWSATDDKFKLALEVLYENYEKASEIMKTIGSKSKSVTKNSYREWPLFLKFRDTDIFKKTYKKVFKEDFVYKESIPSDLETILEEIKTSKKERKEESGSTDHEETHD